MNSRKFKKVRLRITGCLLGALLPALSCAQFDESDDESDLLDIYGDMEMISIATGSEQPVAKAPAVATVITAKTIRDIGATDIDDVLETVPGLHVSRDVIGYKSLYFFRGIASSFNPQVLMLINGVPLTNLFQGDRNLMWGGMPVNAISRIEVIRGPGSAVYGADAFAGVINIITKTASEIGGGEVGARLGSFDSRDAWVSTGIETEEYEFSIVMEYHESDGQDEIIESDAQTALDGVFGTSASLAPGSVNLQRESLDLRADLANDMWRLRMGLQRRRNLGSGAGVAQALDPNNRYQSDRWNVDLTYHNPDWMRIWDITGQLSVLDTSQELDKNLVLFPPGTNIGFGMLPNGLIGNPEVFERHYRFNVSAFYRNFEQHLIRTGVGYFYGDVYKVRESKNFGIDPSTGVPLPLDSPVIDVSDTPYAFLPEKTRSNQYLFVQDVWTLGNDWELTAGVRYDDFSDFGDTTNPRGALVWSTTNRLTTKILYGRAFRAPSFAEQYNANNPVALGNPDIEPETIDSWELAFNYIANRDVNYTVNFFRYSWDDIILFVADANGSTAQNTGSQKGDGVEFDVDWKITSNLHFVANYALQKSTDESSDEDAGRAPEKQAYVNLDWVVKEHWSINTKFTWVMDRARQPGDSRPEVDDYRLLDLSLRSRKLLDNWGVAFIVRNLFDSDVREPSPTGVPAASITNDLPLAGRSVLLEVLYQP